MKCIYVRKFLKAKELIHQRRGGPGAPGAEFFIIFLIVAAVCLIAAVVGFPLMIYYIYKARKGTPQPLSKMEAGGISTSAKSSAESTAKSSPKVTIKAPRTSQIVLLIIMGCLILALLIYLLTML
jgi:hypothetical protein